MNTFFGWLDRNKSLGTFILRLFVGVRLVYGVADNVLSWQHMIQFRDFLQQFHFPVPMLSAIVSVYAQLIAGLMFVSGYKIRWAAMFMIANFIIAILMVHQHDSFEQMTPALAMLFCSLLFLFHGPDAYSLDGFKKQKRKADVR
jgi:putative oxidoreductase